jgi:hypothetical protein
MKERTHDPLRDLLVFALLIAIGVAGRWGQPQWCFTPTAAVTIFAGWYFSRLAAAMMVPIAILAVSDLLLAAHDNFAVMAITYGVMTLPVWFGRMLRDRRSAGQTAFRVAICGFVPAAVFYLATNFAVWAFQSDYEKNWAGLVACYWAAVPFFRWMMAGDLFYLTVLVGCAALAGMPMLNVRHAVPQPAER